MHGIAQHFDKHGTWRSDHRGGARRVEHYTQQRDQVKAHIEKFTRKASHYGRGGRFGRSIFTFTHAHTRYLSILQSITQLANTLLR